MEASCIVDRTTLPDLVRHTTDEYARRGIPIREIGNGWCEEFASDVLTAWIGADWVHREGQGFQTVETANFLLRDTTSGDATDWDRSLLERHWSMTVPTDVPDDACIEVAMREPTHVWIATGGRHYDAEHPDGVDSFFDLNFFRRWFGRDVQST